MNPRIREKDLRVILFESKWINSLKYRRIVKEIAFMKDQQTTQLTYHKQSEEHDVSKIAQTMGQKSRLAQNILRTYLCFLSA